jgi:hypothetical protein
MRPWYAKKRWWLAGAVVVIIVIAVATGGGEDKDDDGGSDEPAAASDGDVEVFALGQTAHTGDFDVTVHAATDPFTPSNTAEPAPQPGNRYVAVDVTMANTSDEPLTVSTLAMVELVDSSDRAWPVTVAGVDLPQLEAINVGPGQARRGWVVFEVGADATDLRVRMKGNLTATGSLFQL